MRPLLGICLLLTAGCANHRMPAEETPPAPLTGQTAIGNLQETVATLPESEAAEAHRRLIVSTAELRVVSLKPDSVHQAVTRLALDFGGYVLGSDNHHTTGPVEKASHIRSVGSCLAEGEV